MHLLKRFDSAQLFRLFVDGRFQKKYNGWVGYEAGEPGSVQALINGFVFMLDHFDLTAGLRATYLLDLHKVCMGGVQTKNLKSSPGDLRFLNAGMPFFPKTTTLENLEEILDMRRGDETAVFNNAAYAKSADDLHARELHNAIQRLGKLNYRNWYPNLSPDQQLALEKKSGLSAFYEAKHAVQMQFVRKVDEIVDRFNQSISAATINDERLRAIALLVRELELLHPFPDGNCRTFACVLLTQLLLNYEFLPALLDNPNLDGEYSLDQWIAEIRNGMVMMEILLKDPVARVYDYSIIDANPDHRLTFAKMSRELVEKINSHQEIFLTPERLISYTGGRWHAPCPPFLRFTGVGTYNTYSPGNVYFALEMASWEKDGKDIRSALTRVLAKDMRVLVLDRPEYADGWNIPVCLVPDALTAFKQVARTVRQELNPLTLLITGTEGKTGAKVQLLHLLSHQTRVHGVRNSANTEIPVLKSLANLKVDDEVEINEVSVGADEAIRVERAMAVNPDLCLFTHLGPNHMDIHKTLDNLLWAKSSVVVGLRDKGICIVDTTNTHCENLKACILKRRPDARIIGYGTTPEDTAQLINSTFDIDRLGWHVRARIESEEVNYFLPIVQNHAPLASVGVLLTIKQAGFDVLRAASDYASLQPFETMGQVTLLPKDGGEVLFYDQSRRGGISGMRSAFIDLANIKGKVKGRVVALVGGISVLRDGDWTREVHHQLAELINQSPIDRLFTTGNYFNYVSEALERIPVKHSNDLEELAATLVQEVQPGDLLFIIGSAYLYLGRVAERVREILTTGKQTAKVVVGDHPRAAEYRLLKVYEDITKGVGAVKASASNGVTFTEYQAALTKHKDYASYRGYLLFGFFNKLSQLLPTLRPLRCVNTEISVTDWKNYVVTPAFCQRWFNNLDKKNNVNNKQIFGSFFDFGDPDYLLHLDAATANLHIGLVHCPNEASTYKPKPMSRQESEQLLQRYPALQVLKPAYRTWGPQWLSVDIGRFIEPNQPDIFLAMADTTNSLMFFNFIRPFVQALDASLIG